MVKSRCENAGLLPRLTAAVYHNMVEEYYIYIYILKRTLLLYI